MNWKPVWEEEFPSVNNIRFGSDITALFAISDELYVATANGGLYCIKNIGLNFAGLDRDPNTMHIVRCEISEAD